VYGSRQIPYRPGQSEELLVQFSEPAMVHVTVDGFIDPGSGDGLLAWLLHPGDGLSSNKSALNGLPLDRAMQAQIGPVPQGVYDLVLENVETDRQTNEVHRSRVEAKAGVNEVAVQLPQLHELRVLLDPSSPLQVSIERPHGWLSIGKGGSRV